ncbi:MAG: hypothetical protein ABIK36_09010 [Pseudomonadota bacterium]
MKRSLLAAALISMAIFGASAEDQPRSAAAAFGAAFCLMKDNPPGADLLVLVTPSLADEIGKALAKNDEIQKAHPDEKPPLGDGIPFQSFPDVSPKCQVGKVEGEGTGAVVEIRHGFPDTPRADYADRIVLGEGWTKGALGIDDVLYGEEGGGGTLRRTLAEAFE